MGIQVSESLFDANGNALVSLGSLIAGEDQTANKLGVGEKAAYPLEFSHTTASLDTDATEQVTIPGAKGYRYMRVYAYGSLGTLQFASIKVNTKTGSGMTQAIIGADLPAAPAQYVGNSSVSGSYNPLTIMGAELFITLKNKHVSPQTITLEVILYP
jgi:hypothetical protein